MKIGPVDPRYPEGKLPDGTPSFTIREDQEWKIQRVMREATQGALIADDMGKGKTLMGTEILLRSAWNRVLIVGIRDTGKQWAKTIADQGDGKVQLRIMNSDVGGMKNWDAFMDGEPGAYFAGIQWLVTRDWDVIDKLDPLGNRIPKVDKKTGEVIPDKFVSTSVHKAFFRNRMQTKKRHLDAVMFDEVHKMQNRNSQTAQTIYSIKSDWRIGLSGTFAGNSFEGAYKVTKWIWPTIVDGSFVRWRDEWCELVTPTRADGTPIQGDQYSDPRKVVGEKIEGAYVKQLPCYIRDEPEPVPPPRVLKVQLTQPQREQYMSIQDRNFAWIAANTPLGREPLITDLPIVQRQRLRTMTLGEVRYGDEEEVTFDLNTPSAKLNTTKFIIDNIWKEMPILIGCYSMDFAKVAAARLRNAGLGAVAWHGMVPTKQRDQIKERFIASDPEFRYLVTTIPSIGTGVDGLQAACSKAIWMERSENRSDNLQWIKRIFRDGMTTDYGEFEHVELVASDTIDEGIILRQDAANRSMSASLRVA